MAHYSSFENLEVYKEAIVFCDAIWDIMTNTPLSKDYKLREQINGSSGSIMDNIAEGFGRGGNKNLLCSWGIPEGLVVRLSLNY